MAEPFPSRPRYMHRRGTYQCLRHQYEAALEQYCAGVGETLARHTRNLAKEHDGLVLAVALVGWWAFMAGAAA